MQNANPEATTTHAGHKEALKLSLQSHPQCLEGRESLFSPSGNAC